MVTQKMPLADPEFAKRSYQEVSVASLQFYEVRATSQLETANI